MYEINCSVHDIVDTVTRRGHLDTRVFNSSSMLKGTELHSLIQSRQGPGYQSEVRFSKTFTVNEFVYHVTGFADGIYVDEDGKYVVDEIKTTVEDLDRFFKDHGAWHEAQAVFYALMLAQQKNLDSVRIRLSYYDQRRPEEHKFVYREFKTEYLKTYVEDILVTYTNFRRKIMKHKVARDESVKGLRFPYGDFRKGQKEMCDFVEDAIANRDQVYIEAPTGIGKTIAALYPAIKTFDRNKVDRILYVTNKNSIKEVAMKTLRTISKQCDLKCIEFTSRENACLNDRKGKCNPDECPFARNYYDKLLDTILDAFGRYPILDRETIRNIAYEKKMCPYQFQLDISAFYDVLTVDCNYVFDYHSNIEEVESDILKRSVLLVDECHNIPSRVRADYSESLSLSELENDRKKFVGQELGKLRTQCNRIIKEIKLIQGESKQTLELQEFPSNLVKAIGKFVEDFNDVLKQTPYLLDNDMLDLYYKLDQISDLIALTEGDTLGDAIDEDLLDGIRKKFLFYAEIGENGEAYEIKMACLDSTPFIKNANRKARAAVYFTATLSPVDYYVDLLGGDPEDKDRILMLDSPFPKENRKVITYTPYRLNLKAENREKPELLREVTNLIQKLVSCKVGNYFVFCPSYEYLETLKNALDRDMFDLVVQEKSMNDIEKENFLSNFKDDCFDKSRVGLVVNGGSFSEGIDLAGDRLIGVFVVSICYPMITFENRKTEKMYKDSLGDERLARCYTYSYPGMNKVLQAAGRVIRSEEDRGIICFIESRYHWQPYSDIIKENYPDVENIDSYQKAVYEVKRFWGEDDYGI